MSRTGTAPDADHFMTHLSITEAVPRRTPLLELKNDRETSKARLTGL
jgi:hypothetical protein